MSWSNIITVYTKELRDLLRDRRTLMSMIVIPTLLMPGLTMATVFVGRNVVNRVRSEKPLVMIVGGENSPCARSALAANSRIRFAPYRADWRQQITDKKVGAAIELPADFDSALDRGGSATIKVYDYDGEMRSGFAASELRRFFTDYREQVVAGRLKDRGLPASLVKPFDIQTENVAPPERVGGNAFGGLIPYFFLLLSFTGAMYPAIDLTAGEKERGTMETILCSPVARTDLVLGKFLMVLTASLGTVVCSLASTVASLLVVGSSFGAGAVASASKTAAAAHAAMPSIDPLGLLASVAMVLPMAVLFAAVQFTVALFAKSYKEAQSYLSPLIVIIILPAVIGMLPGVELNARLALVPILNVSLVSKELVSGVWHWNWIAMIFLSTCLYASAALAVAVRMFSREDVLFRS